MTSISKPYCTLLSSCLCTSMGLYSVLYHTVLNFWWTPYPYQFAAFAEFPWTRRTSRLNIFNRCILCIAFSIYLYKTLRKHIKNSCEDDFEKKFSFHHKPWKDVRAPPTFSPRSQRRKFESGIVTSKRKSRPSAVNVSHNE